MIGWEGVSSIMIQISLRLFSKASLKSQLKPHQSQAYSLQSRIVGLILHSQSSLTA